MEKTKLSGMFESFNSMKILVIGDVMIDSYMWGKVERISPEAPIPVVSVTGKEYRLGGAANVALNIKSMGATPILCSVIGQDFHEPIFRNLLQQKELTETGIITTFNRPTTIKTRVISDSQHLLRVDEEITDFLDTDTEDALLKKITEILNSEKINAIVFEDYDKGVITPQIIEKTTDLAKEKNILTAVDPKKRCFGYYKNISLFKPNFKELTEGLKLNIEKIDFDEIFQSARKHLKQNHIKNVMVTLSEQGVLICNEDNYYHVPAVFRDIADVSGAGDTVISVAALCLAAGFTETETALISNMAGGQVCEKVGVVLVNKSQLLDELLLLE